jgi:hypothetical protein
VQKRDQFSFSPSSRRLVDDPHSSSAAPIQGNVDIWNCNTNVMYPWAAARQILADRSVRGCRLQKLDQRFAALDGCDSGPIGIGQRDLGHLQDVAKKGQNG